MSAFDLTAALANLGDDITLLREVAAAFFGEYPQLLTQIRSGISKGDAAAVRRGAHTLKGAVGTFGPSDAYDLALQLEMMGDRKDLNGANEVMQALEASLRELHPALEAACGKTC